MGASFSSSPSCGQLSRPPTTTPHPTRPSVIGVSGTLPPPYFPSALTSLGRLPCSQEDSNEMPVGGVLLLPLPRSAAPQYCHRVGQVDLGSLWYCGRSILWSYSRAKN